MTLNDDSVFDEFRSPQNNIHKDSQPKQSQSIFDKSSDDNIEFDEFRTSQNNAHENPQQKQSKSGVLFSQGDKIGNYVVTEKIGEGGIGVVYKGHHAILNNLAAIKVHEYFPEHEAVGVAFLQSANYLSQLNHPNIVKLYDYGFQNSHAYMVMEFIDGLSLTELIPKNQTDEWTYRAIQLFIQLLSAVRYAHNCSYLNLAGEPGRGIVHGDIKPQNIFVTRDSNTIKLSDFMIPDVHSYLDQEEPDFVKIVEQHAKPLTPVEQAKIADEWKSITEVFGTPEYMPPEQWRGLLNVRTDIFTLGATFYEMLTGLSPKALFDGIKPRQVNPYLPRWVEQIIIKAMELEPSKRYSSVAEIEAVFLENIHKSPSSANLIQEVIMGDKFDVNTGNIINTDGQLFIGKFNEVHANLSSTGHTEMAEALKVLKEAIMTSKHIDDGKKQEHIEVINQIGEEATKEKPNKTLLKIMGEGLLSALKSVPDIAKAIAAVTPFLKIM